MLMFASVTALVTWLIVDHELWERPSSETARQRAALYNAATALTHYIGIACLYAALYFLVILTAVFVLAPVRRPTVSASGRISARTPIGREPAEALPIGPEM